MMEAEAVCCGAGTIINAIASGKGGAFGIGLETRAKVKLDESGTFRGKIIGLEEDTRLIELCAKKVIEHFGFEYGAYIETKSSIPPARGLKSSSVAANATVLATIGALKKAHDIDIGDYDAINLGVESALDARVTITGAFDDASASFLGGFVITDNRERKIVKSGRMEDLTVLIFVPEEKTYTKDVNVEKMRSIKEEVDFIWNLAMNDMYTAMTLNGIFYGEVTGGDNRIALSALSSGAVAAGMSGTGPAVIALTKNKEDEIIEGWSEFEGNVIKTRTNNEKARIV